ncbi:NAD(P)-binding protein, partial [Choiromyces venosus 120613-1]
LIGTGTIGLSWCAVHLRDPTNRITIYDPREDLVSHIKSLLPLHLSSSTPTSSPSAETQSIETLLANGTITLAKTLESACSPETHILQEQTPENPLGKQSLWASIVPLLPETCHLWTSTSGIPASAQAQDLSASAKARLLVVHPFNPPHILPLIEIVPSPDTSADEVAFAMDYWKERGGRHTPVLVKKETKGFVANRLAAALFREACKLVADGVVGVKEVDEVLEESLGVRWAVKGPFASYHDGGGEGVNGGLKGFLRKFGGTIDEVWKDGMGGREGLKEGWEDVVVGQTEEVYGGVTERSLGERDWVTRRVLGG